VYRIICTMTVTPCSLKSMATPPSSTVSSRQSRDKQPPVAEESHQQYSKLKAIHNVQRLVPALKHTFSTTQRVDQESSKETQ